MPTMDEMMSKKHLAIWIVLTLFFGGLGLVFAFVAWQTALVGLLVYLPLTAVSLWLTVFRRKLWFGLWLLLYLAWLTYLGPYVAVAFARITGIDF